MRYPVHIHEDGGEYIATITHPAGRFQGATCGATQAQARAAATELLAAMFAEALRAGEDIPPPECCDTGNDWVMLPPMLAAKVGLWQELRKQGKRKADIARSLRVEPKQVDRVFSPTHNSTLAQLQATAAALGKTLDVRVT